ncbi:MAG: hypothetical protein ABEL04_12705 [Salinibacter sp.]|uniref:hypothetical protein n=1 Tax=Salinibacter sp. TaxID=2065818 RepID=UPI0035D4EFFB
MIRRALQKIKFEYTSFVARDPARAPLYWPNIWWQQYKIWRHYRDEGASPGACFVSSDTEFVLDGFQGSANSFAAAAFQASQERQVAMAHHMHAPAQIIKAVRKGIPTLVTLREPVGTVLSVTSRWPYISVQQALRSYVGFYEKIGPYRRGYVLSTFEETTQHFGRVIQRVNDRFGTDFDVRDDALERMKAKHGPENPSATERHERQVLKTEKADELESLDCAELLRDARDVHRRMKASVK